MNLESNLKKSSTPNGALKIEVLISTCNEGIATAVQVPGEPEEGVRYLICHQIFADEDANARQAEYAQHVKPLEKRPDVRYISTNTKGLAVNRNQCLSQATGDILLFADDDIHLEEGWADTLRRNFAERKADGLTFKIRTPEGKPFKRYSVESFRHNWRTVMKVSSVELAVRRQAIQSAGLKFDERFGLGAEFIASEENIFLSDALNKGLVLEFVPQYLLTHPRESSGQRMDKPQLVSSKGAFFKRVFGWKGAPLLLAFSLKKWPEYRKTMSPFRFLQLAFSTFGKI